MSRPSPTRHPSPRGICRASRPRVAGRADHDWAQPNARVVTCTTLVGVATEPFGLELLDDEWPFEIDRQSAHLFRHPRLGIADIADVWASDPLFYPAKPPAHWLMVADVAGRVLEIPLAPSDSGDPRRCRPIGCYVASAHRAANYRKDRQR